MAHINHRILLISVICWLQCAISLQNSLPAGNWANHGGDIFNNRYAEGEKKISPSTAPRLRLKWKFNAGHDITATPAVYNGVVYFPTWDGHIFAVRQLDGSLVWKKNLHNLTGLNPTTFNSTILLARANPTVAGDKLIVAIYGPAYVVAVRRATGELVWKRQLDKHPASLITMSGTYYNRAFYVGVSSLEEASSIENCCTFRGSFAKLDIKTGTVLWQTYMLPDNNGRRGDYAGAAIWGSSPSIDERRNHVYIATGNLYSVPQSVEDCQVNQGNQTVPTQPDQCIAPDIHYDSILALDLGSGRIRWFRQLGGYDVWFLACNDPSIPNCPQGPNPDADFGEAPMMLTVNTNGTRKDMVVAVQKSGYAWALDRGNGNLLWSTEAGPGGIGGGGIWGAATDTRRVYTNIANSNQQNFTLVPSKNVTTGGGWVAMEAGRGKVLWSTALPDKASASGPVTIANGVMFAGSTYGTGPVYAVDAASGEILWSYVTGASVYGGFAVSQGCAFVGHGYRRIPSFTAGSFLFAFCIN
ncbi:polyvinylalcohol dehydrogenase-like [Salvia splendens]|uniref:polyvinylalcohol dehydrogenase-like n=1 Tax=Salvia splendens TaxID=180675 RepID=UPI00110434AC|nr:polyvinylalcohol dehydrogenase-like [Salvia splendens]